MLFDLSVDRTNHKSQCIFCDCALTVVHALIQGYHYGVVRQR